MKERGISKKTYITISVVSIIVILLVCLLLYIKPTQYEGICTMYTDSGNTIDVNFDIYKHNRFLKSYYLTGNIELNGRKYEEPLGVSYEAEEDANPFLFYEREPGNPLYNDYAISLNLEEDEKGDFSITLYEPDKITQYWGKISTFNKLKKY